MKWKIEFYEDLKGNVPVDDFYNDLTSKEEKAKIDWVIDLLERMGIELGMPYARSIKGTALWELRPMAHRILYFLVGKENLFVLLHAFKKKTEETPKKHIRVALERMRNYLERRDS